MQDEISDLFTCDEVSEFLEHFLAFSGEGGKWVEGLLSLAPGAVVKGLYFGGFVRGEAEKGLHFLVDVVGLLTEVAFANAIEISQDFRRKLLYIGFRLDDGDLKVAGGDISVGISGSKKGDCF